MQNTVADKVNKALATLFFMQCVEYGPQPRNEAGKKGNLKIVMHKTLLKLLKDTQCDKDLLLDIYQHAYHVGKAPNNTKRMHSHCSIHIPQLNQKVFEIWIDLEYVERKTQTKITHYHSSAGSGHTFLKTPYEWKCTTKNWIREEEIQSTLLINFAIALTASASIAGALVGVLALASIIQLSPGYIVVAFAGSVVAGLLSAYSGGLFSTQQKVSPKQVSPKKESDPVDLSVAYIKHFVKQEKQAELLAEFDKATTSEAKP